MGAAQTAEQIFDKHWREGFHCKCLKAAFDAPKTPRQEHDFRQATDLWCAEYLDMADRTRSSILAGIFGTLFVFNSGLVHELISTETNFTFDEMRRKRQWLLVNTPPSVYGDNGTFIGTGFKYLMQRFVLAHAAKQGDPIHVCWVDEAGQWANQFDAQYISQSRSHRGCLVFLAQSIHSFHTSMRGENGKHHTLALLGNFGHRLLHVLGDVETAEWSSSTLGRRPEMHIGGSFQSGGTLFDELVGRSHFTGSFNTQYEPILQPAVFMNGLRSGGPINNYLADAILIRPGKAFSSGENWLRVTFSQR